MTDNQPPKKSYHKTTKSPAIKRFVTEYARTNNATQAVKNAYPSITTDASASTKGNRLIRNSEVVKDIDQQRKQMERVASKAIDKIEELATHEDPNIAGTNSRYAYDQVHGKATQKIESRAVTAHFTMDLSGGKAGPVPKEILDQLKD